MISSSEAAEKARNEDDFAVGRWVTIHNLVKVPQLNGSIAEVITGRQGTEAQEIRVGVRVCVNHVKKVRDVNIKLDNLAPYPKLECVRAVLLSAYGENGYQKILSI